MLVCGSIGVVYRVECLCNCLNRGFMGLEDYWDLVLVVGVRGLR